jgi:hypothetical protein
MVSSVPAIACDDEANSFRKMSVVNERWRDGIA